MGTNRDYICDECGRKAGMLPREVTGPLRGTTLQQKWMRTHTQTNPTKPVNGVFYSSDTNTLRVLLNEAGIRGVLEEESGSTNVICPFDPPIGRMEELGILTGDADGLRWIRSSNADQPHFYPIRISSLGHQTHL